MNLTSVDLRASAATVRASPEAGAASITEPEHDARMHEWIQASVGRALEMEETSRLILESAGDGIFGLDLDGFVTFVNPAAYRMTGWTLEDLQGRTQHSMVHHSHADGTSYPREECPIYKALRDGLVHHREDEVFWRKDGSCFSVAYTSTPLRRSGEILGAVVIFRDITQQAKEQQWEQDKLKIFENILAGGSLAETLSLLAKAFSRMYPLLEVRIDQYLGGEMVSQALSGPALDGGGAPRLDPETSVTRETTELVAQGGESLGRLVVTGRGMSAAPEFRVVERQVANFARLAMERLQLTDKLVHQSQHDALTGLPNRALLEDRLEQAILRGRRRGSMVGVCYIDLDRFKEINDTLGHGQGDRYLQMVSTTLRAHCRQMDTLARQGGDEFILVLPDMSDAMDAEGIAERLLHALRQQSFDLGDDLCQATASIGISMYPIHGEASAQLLQKADTALYAAKRAGRDRSFLFTEELGVQTSRQAKISADIRKALSRQEFFLQYQPLYGREMAIEGFEALVRWRHPEQGLIRPDEFIPIAEETGQIVALGEWVLGEATRQAMRWQHEGAKPLRMFVNISGVQLSKPGLASIVRRSLDESGLPAAQLELEITESWIVSDPVLAGKQLEELRALGIGLSIDDFGTGQSSLSCLHKLPVDTLKIDRSFVSRMTQGSAEMATVRAILCMAQQLGLKTVGEGVETPEQLDALHRLGCDMLQGFLMAKPLDAAAADEALVRGWSR